MAYVITDLCKRARLCVDVCPTDSIHCVDGDPDWPTYYISPDSCIDCGACEAECPEEAIFADDEVPGEYPESVSKNETFFTEGPGKDLVD